MPARPSEPRRSEGGRPLIALTQARLAFGERPLFHDLDLRVPSGERACLVGRNGSGKSTLLKVLAGSQTLDGGERTLRAGARVAYLPQDPSPPADAAVRSYVEAGLEDLPEAERLRLGPRVAGFLKHLSLDPEARCGALSGGEARRAALARVLASAPEVLLLDEPTNHLDLPTIEWLERELARFRGALLVISHDRRFLERVAGSVLWLDRGRLRRLDKPISAFEDWAETLLAEEAEARHKLDRRIVREERWLARGVTARRRRNQGRLARLQALRRERAGWLRTAGTAALEAETAAGGGKIAIEAEGLAKAFEGPDGQRLAVIEGFSTRIARGDRIGIIGPNGAGKTTLVKLLIGALAPDAGRLKLGAGIESLVFDQRRESLDPEASLWKTLVPGGGDSIMVRSRQRHVVGYLRDFLFHESQARQPVKSLSGGEKSRLLLARLFARPSNLLVMDEPTNDLDLETLDLLVEVLDGYEGTLLLVSHDRDFLDRLVTSVVALEGDGRVVEHAGGFSDYERRRKEAWPDDEKPAPRRKAATPGRPRRAAGKLGYKEARELEALPDEIARLEAAIAGFEAKLTDPGLYARDPQAFADASAELAAARDALAAAEERWLALEERREALAAGQASSDAAQ